MQSFKNMKLNSNEILQQIQNNKKSNGRHLFVSGSPSSFIKSAASRRKEKVWALKHLIMGRHTIGQVSRQLIAQTNQKLSNCLAAGEVANSGLQKWSLDIF